LSHVALAPAIPEQIQSSESKEGTFYHHLLSGENISCLFQSLSLYYLKKIFNSNDLKARIF